MIPRLLLLSILASIWLTPICSSWSTTVEEQQAFLLDQKKQAENKGDSQAVAAIDTALDQLKDYSENKDKPLFEVLADPENNHFAFVVKGSLVKPDSLPPEMAKLVPPAPHPAWREVSFPTILEALGDKVVLLHPHMTHVGNSPTPRWVIDQKEVDAILKPEDPNAPPRIGIYVFPPDNQPVSGIIPIQEDTKQ